MGVENLAPDIGTTAGNEEGPRTVGLGSLAGVEAIGLKRDGMLGEFSEVLVENDLRRGDLKGFIEAFPSLPKIDGIGSERFPDAVGVEKYAADWNDPLSST
jgi:hypothetical protein